MKKSQALLSPFNSQPALFARVCLPAQKHCSEAPLDRLDGRQNIATELNLHRHSYLTLTSCPTQRCLCAFKSP